MFGSSSVQEPLKPKDGVRERKQINRETFKQEANPNKPNKTKKQYHGFLHGGKPEFSGVSSHLLPGLRQREFPGCCN